MLATQRAAGNHLLARWIAARPVRPLLQRLARAQQAAPTQFDSITISGLKAQECYAYLAYLKQFNVTPPCSVDLGVAGIVQFADKDDETLRARMKQELPVAVAALQKALKSDKPEFERRQVGTLTPDQAADLVDQMSKDTRVSGFEDWLLGNAGKLLPLDPDKPGDEPEKRKGRLDQINELREAARLLTGPQSKLDVSERSVPGTSGVQTADITTDAGPQTEVKTIRDPVTSSLELNAQMLAACAKFDGATRNDNRAVIYASYAPKLFTGKRKLNKDTGKFVMDVLGVPKDVGEIWVGPLRVLNDGLVPGSDKVAEIVYRIENGKSWRLVAGANAQWSAELI